LTSDKNVGDIAKSVGKTVAQILLKWAVQQNIGNMTDFPRHKSTC
jgi:diketogulonate reductase-like aldo/keto reductase